jgi:hypothetical protein
VLTLAVFVFYLPRGPEFFGGAVAGKAALIGDTIPISEFPKSPLDFM